MLFRSLRSLAGRALAAGAASALTLTLFNAAQPTIATHKLEPGTLKSIKVTLAPASAPTTRAVDNAGRLAPGSAAVATRLQSGPVEVGKARFVGFSWPDADARTEDATVSMRARTAAGWSAWREVEQAGDGPDATSGEYRAGRAYSDGQWLDAGTATAHVRVDPPAAGAGLPRRRRLWPRTGSRPHDHPGPDRDPGDRQAAGRGGHGGHRPAEDHQPGRLGRERVHPPR